MVKQTLSIKDFTEMRSLFCSSSIDRGDGRSGQEKYMASWETDRWHLGQQRLCIEQQIGADQKVKQVGAEYQSVHITNVLGAFISDSFILVLWEMFVLDKLLKKNKIQITLRPSSQTKSPIGDLLPKCNPVVK